MHAVDIQKVYLFVTLFSVALKVLQIDPVIDKAKVELSATHTAS